MSSDLWIQVLVNLSGFGFMFAVAWFHWGPRSASRAQAVGGTQEAAIIVRGGYAPDVVIVDAHRPIRLRFTRQETSSCTERVVFDGLEVSARLPTGQEVDVDLPALDPGEYPFACQMGMIRGKLIVREA